MELDRIDELVKEYLLHVMSALDMTIEDLEDDANEDIYDNFKFEASNNYDKSGGYDFVAWYISKGYSTCDILDIGTMTTLYLQINAYFAENYGEESVMKWNDFSPANVLRNYVYFYLYGYLSKEELVEVLRGDQELRTP